MFLFHFEIIRHDLAPASRYLWATEEEEAFALLYDAEKPLIDQERVKGEDVIFEVVSTFSGRLVYWMPEGEA